LVLNYLGVNNNSGDEKSNENHSRSKNNQSGTNNNYMHRQFSNMLPSRSRTIEEFNKELELQRTDSFLPSNTGTGNRSQLSQVSIESLSQFYGQNMRLKFGSAPAQLLSEGREAELSLEKRASAIKKQFQLAYDVSTRTQVSRNMNKQQNCVLASPSWAKKDDPSTKVQSNQKPKPIRYDEEDSSDSDSNNNRCTNDDDDDDDILIVNLNSRYSSGRGSKLTSPNPVK
jgi:hypothetical protein